MGFQFGNVVVVEGNLIGCIVKSWPNLIDYNYDVYVRNFNSVREYRERDIQHYIYSKDVPENELEFYGQ